MLLLNHQEVMRSNYAAIFMALKRSNGMAIGELAEVLKMSYMGVKGSCLKLVELGYLRDWRVPREKKEVGRPEKMYFLTPKCDVFFPEECVGLTLSILEGVKQSFGEAAPEKMLLHFFHGLRDEWLPHIAKGTSLRERVLILSKLRERVGWLNQVFKDAVAGVWIEEYHHPMRKIFEVYPKAERMECLMLEQLLGDRVERVEVENGKGRRRVILEIPALKKATGAPIAEGPHDDFVPGTGQGELF